MNKLAVVGASGHGKVIADLAELCGYEVAFFDDNYPTKSHVEHWLIQGSFSDLIEQVSVYKHAIIAIGNNKIRARLFSILTQAGFSFPTLVHPSSNVSKYAKLSSGTVVLAGAMINSFANIGENCILNTGSIVEHDCYLADNIHLSPNVALAGGTIVGSCTWFGIGSVTVPLINVGENVIIGANSTITKNIPSDVIAFGTPAVIKN